MARNKKLKGTKKKKHPPEIVFKQCHGGRVKTGTGMAKCRWNGEVHITKTRCPVCSTKL